MRNYAFPSVYESNVSQEQPRTVKRRAACRVLRAQSCRRTRDSGFALCRACSSTPYIWARSRVYSFCGTVHSRNRVALIIDRIPSSFLRPPSTPRNWKASVYDGLRSFRVPEGSKIFKRFLKSSPSSSLLNDFSVLLMDDCSY